VNAQRLSRIAAGIAIVTALGVAGLVTRNVLWPDDPDASLHSTGGKMLGDMAGYVGRVDRETRTVDVSTSPLGIRPVAMVVTNETAIVVNGKQGAIGDLWKDLPVRVYYEVRDSTRYATSIQVTSAESLAASPVGKDTAAPSAPVTATAPPAAPAPMPTRPALPPASVATPPRPPVSAPVVSKPTPPPATVATPVVPAAARVAEPAPAPSRAPVAVPATESASVGSSGAASPGAGRPAPAESEADGSAAIDWLLKGTGRR
jgi:hypothetical protein